MSDRDLVELLQCRDQQGFHELQQSYGPLMRYIISPILPDPREQEECLADLSLLIWDKIHLYDPDKGGFKTWLSVLTRNTALNRARSSRASVRSQEFSLETLSYQLPASDPTPEEYLLKKERLEHLKSAISSLHPKDQLLFYRKYYYLQPTAQIAAELGQTERAVEGKLYRIKKCLKNMLRKDGFSYD
ncbi:MAG: sigma-70 family RNA polymerase sigma factor [Lachnospiraceae bacterium]|nr:sigma-70 family RNA polymerase sigma factor [Lachnospiraceae bacterium]